MQILRSGIRGRLQRFSDRILQVARAQATDVQKLLIVSDAAGDGLKRLCQRLNLEPSYTSDLSLALENLQCAKYDVVIYDHDLAYHDWQAAIAALARASPTSSILLMSTSQPPYVWKDLTRRGGHDVLQKPISGDEAESIIALAKVRARVNRVLSD